MERVAIPIWEGRISPVLDAAERLWICDLDGGGAGSQRVVEFRAQEIGQRTEELRSLGIGTLLCGALSRPLHNLLLSAGIAVIPWLTGAVDEVLAAYSNGRLDLDRFRLPGCRRRRMRGCSMRATGVKRKGRSSHRESS